MEAETTITDLSTRRWQVNGKEQVTLVTFLQERFPFIAYFQTSIRSTPPTTAHASAAPRRAVAVVVIIVATAPIRLPELVGPGAEVVVGRLPELEGGVVPLVGEFPGGVVGRRDTGSTVGSREEDGPSGSVGRAVGTG